MTTHLTDSVIAVEVPKEGLHGSITAGGTAICFSRVDGIFPLPPGAWFIIANANDITEKQAEDIVDEELQQGGFRDYMNEAVNYTVHDLHTALESFRSLMASKGLAFEDKIESVPMTKTNLKNFEKLRKSREVKNFIILTKTK